MSYTDDIEQRVREQNLTEACLDAAGRLAERINESDVLYPLIKLESAQLLELLAALRRLRKQRLVEVA